MLSYDLKNFSHGSGSPSSIVLRLSSIRPQLSSNVFRPNFGSLTLPFESDRSLDFALDSVLSLSLSDKFSSCKKMAEAKMITHEESDNSQDAVMQLLRVCLLFMAAMMKL